MMQRGVKSMIVAEIFLLDDADQIFLLIFAAGRCDSLLYLEVGVRSYRCKMQQGVKSYRCMMQRGVKSYLYMTQRGVKSYRSMLQRGVNLAAGSLTTLEDSLRPLKRQSCKKITYETPSPSYSYENLFFNTK
jgi:hypothetical protein